MKCCPGAHAFKLHTTTSKKTLDKSFFFFITAYETNNRIVSAYRQYDIILFHMCALMCSDIKAIV